MQKNKINYQTEPTQKTCKSDQMNCIEFVDYINKYFKKVDKETFDVLHPYKYKNVVKDHPDLIYQLLLGINDLPSSEKNVSNKLLLKQIEINNKRKSQIRDIINKKLKHTLTFEMLREVDSEIESIMIKRKKAYKRKKKDEDVSHLKELLERRKVIENDLVLVSQADEYVEEDDVEIPGLILDN